ncbi:MAG: hypothetical protein ACRDFS_01470, partial [Chloroflexota bacterium]
HGLCIPSERITSLQGSAFGEAIAHMKTDVSVTPEVTMQFSSDELAREISGYIPEIPGKVGTYMGSTVVVWPLPDAARPGGPAHFIQEDRDLWNLTGWWKDSSVLKVPGTNLYRVTRPENQKYDDFFELVSID